MKEPWISATEAAEILSANSGRPLISQYVRDLAMKGKIAVRPMDGRTNLYLRVDVEKIKIRSNRKKATMQYIAHLEESAEETASTAVRHTDIPDLPAYKRENGQIVRVPPVDPPTVIPEVPTDIPLFGPIPPDCLMAAVWAETHGIDNNKMRKAMIHGIDGEKLIVCSRPKPGRPTDTERWLTPEQQQAALDYMRRHNVPFKEEAQS